MFLLGLRRFMGMYKNYIHQLRFFFSQSLDYLWRLLHGGEEISILRRSAANECDIIRATRT